MIETTHAITIAAPPSAVWPWLIQGGYRGAGRPEAAYLLERLVDAAHQLDQALADRQAQARAAVLARGRGVDLAERLEQPALALSSPAVTGDNEDGLLTMGEVLKLKLNADWVVLSACNTGAAAGQGTEALSGLGRAFFYAGTRSLLVSIRRSSS